jgi:uncharacterized protein YjbI with pentapeptide repeats
METVQDRDWDTCEHHDCIGARLTQSLCCIVHASGPERAAAMDEIGQYRVLDARGVTISVELLDQILTAVADPAKSPRLKSAAFNHAVFEDNVDFSGVAFEDDATFYNARFNGRATFIDAEFYGVARFSGVTFAGRVWFSHATFHDEAWFGLTTFKQNAWFTETTFRRRTWFGWSTFHDDATFVSASFFGKAGFTATTFERNLWLNRAVFYHKVEFNQAVFERARDLGPFLVKKSLVLDDAVFRERAEIEVAAAALCCKETKFASGIRLRVRWASIVLDNADLAQPSLLIGTPASDRQDEDDLARRWKRLPFGSTTTQPWRPRLISIAGADVSGLTITNIDLRPCRFIRCHNLDKLKLEGEPPFAYPPANWRWTRRKTLAEEQHWRATRRERWSQSGWYPQACKPLSVVEEPPAVLQPIEISSLYRQLRKSREDAKDEPGAADFYYGEMEMRRHAARRWSVESVMLTAYWLVSGYALRAWRTFTTLAIMIAVAAVIFASIGFRAPESPRFSPIDVGQSGELLYERQHLREPSFLEQLPGAFGYAAEVSTSLLRGPDRPVTVAGEWTRAVLRFLGPTLLALALVSLRGRLKR